MRAFILIFSICSIFSAVYAQKGTAQLTWYESYARCCTSNPNYDPNVPTEECDLYSAW